MYQTCKTVPAAFLFALAAGLPAALPDAAAAEQRVLAVQHVNHKPVADLTNTIQPLLEDIRRDESLGEITLAADAVGNSLVIRGTPDAVKQVTTLIQELDQKPRTVLVNVTLTGLASKEPPKQIPMPADGKTTAEEILQALKQQGEVQILARAQLSALDNQPAYLNLARREPMVTGVMESSRGKTRQVEFENVGIKLGLTPRINPDGSVTLEADLERSDLGDAERGIPFGPVEGERAEAIDVLSIQTTVSARDRQTVVLGGLADRQGERWTRRIALLTVHIVP